MSLMQASTNRLKNLENQAMLKKHISMLFASEGLNHL